MSELYYLAGPYSGKEHQRYMEICLIAARLMFHRGIIVYSPIAHSHQMAQSLSVLGTDWLSWKQHNDAMMSRCDSLIVAHMDGWDKSKGVGYEIHWFERHGRPIFDLEPTSLELTKRDRNNPVFQSAADE